MAVQALPYHSNSCHTYDDGAVHQAVVIASVDATPQRRRLIAPAPRTVFLAQRHSGDLAVAVAFAAAGAFAACARVAAATVEEL